eukprot:495365_1
MSLSSVRNESMESNTSNTRKRKRSIESSTDDSLLPSPPRKRPQYDMNSNKSNPSQSALTSPSKYNRFDIDHEADMHSHKPSDDIKREDEEKQFEMDKREISHNTKQTEEGKEKEGLMHDGEYSLALPIIDCNRHKFDPQRTVNIIANALKQFMSIHRHPKLRIIVIATTQYRDALHGALKTQYNNSNNYDERIILYSGAWDEIVQLRDNGLCCQYLTNFTFWDFSGKKGDKLNKLIHSKCDSLRDLSIAKYRTANRKCVCYSVEINADNGGDLYKTQGIRCVVQTRPPSLNPKLHDFVEDGDSAYTDLYDMYYALMDTFYTSSNINQNIDGDYGDLAPDILKDLKFEESGEGYVALHVTAGRFGIGVDIANTVAVKMLSSNKLSNEKAILKAERVVAIQTHLKKNPTKNNMHILKVLKKYRCAHPQMGLCFVFISAMYHSDLMTILGTLRRKFKDRIIPLNIVSVIACGVCRALEVLHGAKIIHRDIKPHNLLMNKNYETVLIDLSMSKQSESDDVLSHTNCGTILFAPEVQFEEPYNSWVDLFALMMTLLFIRDEKTFYGIALKKEKSLKNNIGEFEQCVNMVLKNRTRTLEMVLKNKWIKKAYCNYQPSIIKDALELKDYKCDAKKKKK